MWLGIHKLHDFFWFKFSVQEFTFFLVKSLVHFFERSSLHELLLVHVLCLSPHNVSNGPSQLLCATFFLADFRKNDHDET